MPLTPEQLEERIPILRAACAGKTVQRIFDDKWTDATPSDILVRFLEPRVRWRIKPEPEPPEEVFVNIYPDGPVGAHKTPGLADAAAGPHRLSCRRYVLAEEPQEEVFLKLTTPDGDLMVKVITEGEAAAAEHESVKAFNEAAETTPAASKPLDGWVNVYNSEHHRIGNFFRLKSDAQHWVNADNFLRTARVVEVPEEAQERWIVDNADPSLSFHTKGQALKWRDRYSPSARILHVIEKA